MISRRVFKQAAYAAGFLLVLAAIIFAVVFNAGRPALTPFVQPSPGTSLLPLEIEAISTIVHPQAIDVVARVRNPNAKIGVRRYILNYDILDQGGTSMVSHQEESYLLPGAMQYVVAQNVAVPRRAGQVSVSLAGQPEFVALPDRLSLPTFSSFLRDRAIVHLGGEAIEQRQGLVANTSTYDFARVEVAVIGFDKDEHIISAGKTFLGTLTAGEQREFSVQWPLPLAEVVRAIAVPTTNIFLDENVLRVIGNPSSLR